MCTTCERPCCLLLCPQPRSLLLLPLSHPSTCRALKFLQLRRLPVHGLGGAPWPLPNFACEAAGQLSGSLSTSRCLSRAWFRSKASGTAWTAYSRKKSRPGGLASALEGHGDAPVRRVLCTRPFGARAGSLGCARLGARPTRRPQTEDPSGLRLQRGRPVWTRDRPV